MLEILLCDFHLLLGMFFFLLPHFMTFIVQSFHQEFYAVQL